MALNHWVELSFLASDKSSSEFMQLVTYGNEYKLIRESGSTLASSSSRVTCFALRGANVVSSGYGTAAAAGVARPIAAAASILRAGAEPQQQRPGGAHFRSVASPFSMTTIALYNSAQ